MRDPLTFMCVLLIGISLLAITMFFVDLSIRIIAELEAARQAVTLDLPTTADDPEISIQKVSRVIVPGG